MGVGAQLISLHLFIFIYYICMCVSLLLLLLLSVCDYGYMHVYGGQKTAFRSCFSPSNVGLGNQTWIFRLPQLMLLPTAL